MAISEKLLALTCMLGLSLAGLAGCSSGKSGSNVNSSISEHDIEEVMYDEDTGETFTCITNTYVYRLDTDRETDINTKRYKKYKTDDFLEAGNCKWLGHYKSYEIVESFSDALFLLDQYDDYPERYGWNDEYVDAVATEIAILYDWDGEGEIFVKTKDGYITDLKTAASLYAEN